MNEGRQDPRQSFDAMCRDLQEWRSEHPEAHMDEIAGQITPRRRAVMGALLMELALQHGNGYEVEGCECARCGQQMEYKGTPEREVIQLEGDGTLARAYYYCTHCQEGFFPPGSTTTAGAPRVDPGDDRPSDAPERRNSVCTAGAGEL